eukprot:12848338-Ditylum_brightwellii.AAC.2
MSLLPLTAQITTGSMSVRGSLITYEGILIMRKHYRVFLDDDFYEKEDMEGASLEGQQWVEINFDDDLVEEDVED